ncbi:MAG: biofilm regulation phosphoprotein SiaC [Methylococcales bacterium]|nr:biofilm regulation phosphoprotein SiaC [Methylococcales bacterium]
MVLATLDQEQTKNTPAVQADPVTGLFRMMGDSYPENSFEFFAPLIEWIEAFLETNTEALTLELNIAYMNTSSVKAMMDIFDLMEEAFQQGRKVQVAWFYDSRNERVVEMIEEFQEDCSFIFEIKKINDACDQGA